MHTGEEDLTMYSSTNTIPTKDTDTFHRQMVEITNKNITELRQLGIGKFGEVACPNQQLEFEGYGCE